jgi:hypothetical protein
MVPVDVLCSEQARGGLGSVRDSYCATHAKASLGEVQAIADRAADTVVRHPAQQGSVYAALKDQALYESPDLVVGEGRDDAGTQAEAAAEATRHVVLSPPFPNPEVAGGANAPLPRIEPKHHLAEGDRVVRALPRGTQVKFVHRT